jgi:hypothetical protein
MVIKGKSVAGAQRLALHLEREDTNARRNEVIEMRDVAASDLQGALREMEAIAAGGCPNCKKPLYHASINTPVHERLTDEQRMAAIDRLEKELGLTRQPRVVVVHEKNDGREHCHVVWSRIDQEKMRAISDSHNFRKHEIVARELERSFGHERVQGAHIERDGKPRPERTASHKEHQQADRTGIRPKAAKELITRFWKEADSGKAFQAALEKEGWILARGDRRDFVVVDPKGGTHSLARRIEGAKVAHVRERLADVNVAELSSVAEARTQQAAIREQKKERVEALGRLRSSDIADNLVMGLDVKGTERNQKREAQQKAIQDAWRNRVEEQTAEKVDAGARVMGVAKEGLRVADKATGAVMGLADFMSNIVSGHSKPVSMKDRGGEIGGFIHDDPKLRKEQQLARYAAMKAEKEADRALERIEDDMKAGKALSAADIRNLTEGQQQTLRHFGDEGMQRLIQDLHKRNERYWSNEGRERERD